MFARIVGRLLGVGFADIKFEIYGRETFEIPKKQIGIFAFGISFFASDLVHLEHFIMLSLKDLGI